MNENSKKFCVPGYQSGAWSPVMRSLRGHG